MTETKFIQDPWSKMTTRNGLRGDEAISALQKSIRRGKEKEACEFAYEMYITSPQFEEKLWRRLLAISVEDVGMGNPMAAIMINNLNAMRKEFQYNESDRAMYFSTRFVTYANLKKIVHRIYLRTLLSRVSLWDIFQKFLILRWINILFGDRQWGVVQNTFCMKQVK